MNKKDFCPVAAHVRFNSVIYLAVVGVLLTALDLTWV